MAVPVTIVTPSYQMAPFLEQAIGGVLAQDYPDLEYIVLDGGSTDGSVDILARYSGRLRWRSRPDAGAAAALREGFDEARGEVFGWLNADDILRPGAIREAVDALERMPHLAAVYGDAVWIDEQGHTIRPYPTGDFRPERLARECFICQPACFFRAAAYRAAGKIDPRWASAFDYDLWIRLARQGPLLHVPSVWAHSRMHAANKTLGCRGEAFREGMAVLQRHYGYVPFQWIYSERVWRRDARDQFFEPLEPSLAAYLASLPAGLWRNRRRPWRYFMDWIGGVDWRGRLSRATHRS